VYEPPFDLHSRILEPVGPSEGKEGEGRRGGGEKKKKKEKKKERKGGGGKGRGHYHIASNPNLVRGLHSLTILPCLSSVKEGGKGRGKKKGPPGQPAVACRPSTHFSNTEDEKKREKRKKEKREKRMPRASFKSDSGLIHTVFFSSRGEKEGGKKKEGKRRTRNYDANPHAALYAYPPYLLLISEKGKKREKEKREGGKSRGDMIGEGSHAASAMPLSTHFLRACEKKGKKREEEGRRKKRRKERIEKKKKGRRKRENGGRFAAQGKEKKKKEEGEESNRPLRLAQHASPFSSPLRLCEETKKKRGGKRKKGEERRSRKSGDDSQLVSDVPLPSHSAPIYLLSGGEGGEGGEKEEEK